MANTTPASKAFAVGNRHVRVMAGATLERTEGRNIDRPTRVTRTRARRTRMPRIRFRFVLIADVDAREELWTSGALPVDGQGGRLRGFRKSHHLILAGSRGRSRDCSWQRRDRDKNVSACCVRITTVTTSAKARSRRHVPPRKHYRFPEQPARGGRR